MKPQQFELDTLRRFLIILLTVISLHLWYLERTGICYAMQKHKISLERTGIYYVMQKHKISLVRTGICYAMQKHKI